MKPNDLLKEFIKESLNEDDTGGAGYGGGMNLSSYGMGYMNYGGSLKSIFVQPFIDASGVIKAATGKALLRIKSLAKIVIETILTTMIPFLKSNYEEIFKIEHEQLKKLKEKYKDAFKGVDAAFTKDVMVLAFMVNPQQFITAKLAAQAPKQIIEILQVLTIKNEGLAKYFDDLKSRLDTIHKDLHDDPANYKLDASGKAVPKNSRGPYLTQKKKDLLNKAGLQSAGKQRVGKIVSEQTLQSEELKIGEELAQALKSPEVINAIKDSSLAKAMGKDAILLTDDLAKKILDEASRILSADSLNTIQRILGRPLPLGQLDSLSPEERQESENAILTQVKAAAKDFYRQSIMADINGLQTDGVDSNNLYIKTLQNIIAKIDAM